MVPYAAECFARLRGRIGLLGGSFNPAHEGHLHLSLEACRVLGLDHVVWLVSPLNPLKRSQDIAPYATRLAHAEKITAHQPCITVSDFEQRHQLYFTAHTVAALQQRYQTHHFVWLMGADNLTHFHRWRQWRELFSRIPVCVFDRAPFSHAALRQKAALHFDDYRLFERSLRLLPVLSPPVWGYHFMPRHPQSATDIRKRLGDNAFL